MSAPAVELQEDYLQAYTLRSWLLTTDHKRIGAPVHGLDHVLLLRRRGRGDASCGWS